MDYEDRNRSREYYEFKAEQERRRRHTTYLKFGCIGPVVALILLAMVGCMIEAGNSTL